MADEIAISVQAVSKAYRIWETPAGRLTSPILEKAAQILSSKSPLARSLTARAAKNYKDFWALRDISFEVRRGEAIGIIGRNGSGKSTLLQIIAGTLQPSLGRVHVNGRVAALLELGSGFNPEFTGRENVFLGGSILGLSEQTLKARFDQIAAFAEIGGFIDQPVKTYSSGMTVRLAFALAAHVDADVLIIDEALAVGDARFQLKCARTIDRFVDEGRTLLFVSHDPSSITRLCSAALLLEQGRLQLVHSPRVVTNLYAKMVTDDRGLAAIAEDLDNARHAPFDRVRCASSRSDAAETIQAETRCVDAATDGSQKSQLTPRASAQLQRLQQLTASEDNRSAETSGREFSMGDGGVVIEAIEPLDANSLPQRVYRSGAPLRIRAELLARSNIVSPIFAFRIRNTKGLDIYGTNTFFKKLPTPDLIKGERVEVLFDLTASFLAGQYFLSVSCSHFEADKLIVHHRRYDAVEITVLQDDHSFGIAQCNAAITARILSNPTERAACESSCGAEHPGTRNTG